MNSNKKVTFKGKKLTTNQRKLVKEYIIKLKSNQMLKEDFIAYDDLKLKETYSHDRMGYVISGKYIEALQNLGYSKNDIYVIYGSTYTRHMLDSLFDKILPNIKSFMENQTKKLKPYYDKMLNSEK